MMVGCTTANAEGLELPVVHHVMRIAKVALPL